MSKGHVTSEDSIELSNLTQSNGTSSAPKMESIEKKALDETKTKNKSPGVFPLHNVHIVSYLLYSWLEPFMWKAFRRRLGEGGIWTCHVKDGAQENSARLSAMWAEEEAARGENASMRRVFLRFVRRRLILATFVLFLAMIGLLLCSCYLLMQVLHYSRHHSSDDIYYGIIVVVILFLTDIVQNVLFIAVFTITHIAGIRLRSGVLFLLYTKLLNMDGLRDKTIGYVVNLFATDSQRIFDGVSFAPMILIAPVLILATTGYSIYLLGPWALVGFLVLILLFPLQMAAGKIIMSYRSKTVLVTDKRVRIMNEVLSHIKFIKMYVWEEPFTKQISDVRSKERSLVEKNTLAIIIAMLLSLVIVSIATSLTIILCSISGYDITPITVFTYVTVYSSVQGKLMLSTMAVKCLSEFFVSADRFQAILQMKNSSESQSRSETLLRASDYVIELKNVSAKWPPSTADGDDEKGGTLRKDNHHIVNERSLLSKPELENLENTLIDISLKVEQGDVVVVTGGIGSGKSALLSCILGQMQINKGNRVLNGKLAYVPQTPWTYHASLKDNIVFGNGYNEERYSWVIDMCCLKSDIATFPKEDDTIIGERGLTLSGGQKQRISLARALYSDRDIFILDDPFSAIDPDIAEQLFKNLITGAMVGKTIILSSSRHQFINNGDLVVYMNGGQVMEQGSPEDLMDQGGFYANYYNTIKEKDPYSSSSTSAMNGSRLSTFDKHPLEANANTLTPNKLKVMNMHDREEECIGAVKLSTYWMYIKASGGVGALTVTILMFLLAEGCRAFGFYWLAHWLSQGSGVQTLDVVTNNNTTISTSISDHPHLYYYNTVYGGLLIAMIIIFVIRSIFVVKFMIKASSKLHLKLFRRVIKAPMLFFESTPMGRIVNRFSKDMDELDTELPVMLDQVLETIIGITLYTVLIGLILRWFLIAVPILLFLFLLANCIFRVGAREVKRLHNSSMAPVLTHVTSSMEGLHSIRAYDKTDQYISMFERILDSNSVIILLYNFCMRWINVRLSIITSIVVGVVALILVVLPGHVSPPMAGLAIVFAAQLSTLFQHFVRSAVETEAKFTSVERILSYVNSTLQEKETVCSLNTKPLPEWPKSGHLKMHKVSFQYQPHLPVILKNISCEIPSGNCVGVVGRTGAGKSTLAACLYRLVDLKDGSITYDGMDTTSLKLSDLRGNMSIIPQEPVLFAGTVRNNLDPWKKHIDMEIWRALEACNVKSTVLSLEEQLDAEVLQNGENFSVGERQLLCLARVLLRRSKILILDEATASVDSQTDLDVQVALKQAFTDCTILIIAHRLSTIMNCTKVIVLEEGQIIEYDDPSMLLDNPHSHFSKLMAIHTDNPAEAEARQSIMGNKAWV